MIEQKKVKIVFSPFGRAAKLSGLMGRMGASVLGEKTLSIFRDENVQG